MDQTDRRTDIDMNDDFTRLMSLAIFMMEQATTLHAPLTSTMASWEASASNLLGAVTKGRPVSSDTLEATWRQRYGFYLLIIIIIIIIQYHH